MKVCVVTPWHNEKQRDAFCEAWGVMGNPSEGLATDLVITLAEDRSLLLVQDADQSGCARTKNRGLLLAKKLFAEVAVVLDDDCFPSTTCHTPNQLIDRHLACLEPQRQKFLHVTIPPSRGTPHRHREVEMPVAASMGFWSEVGDVDAVTQLVLGSDLTVTHPHVVHGKYFPLCGMNLAFRLDWWPWCQFVDVPRYDDIWMGWLWMKRAYATGCCFNLGGPTVRHSRQSNVWANLRAEAPNMEISETLWEKIAKHPSIEYEELVKLLPGRGP